MNAALSQCSLPINTTLPLVCICSLFSFLCGVGIGANDLSANFAMVVGSGSLDMKKAIVYCTVFELLGAAFMGGHVSNSLRNGIVDASLFNINRDVVVLGMTAASFAAALWLYLSTVFGLPVSITHTVVGSLLGYAVFSTFGFDFVKARGLMVIVISWVAAPVAAFVVTAIIFFCLRRDVFKVKGRSFELALRVLPLCLLSSLLVDYAFVIIEQPPIMTSTFARYVPVPAQFVLLLLFILFFVYAAKRWYFPHVVDDAWVSTSFVWESRALRTETVEPSAQEAAATAGRLDNGLSFFSQPDLSSSSSSCSSTSSNNSNRGDLGKPGDGAAVCDHSHPPLDASESTPLLRQHSSSTGSGRLSSQPPLAGGACASAPTFGSARAAAQTGSSVVLASITPSDTRMRVRGSVRLAPTGRRSPLPSVSGRNTPGGGSSNPTTCQLHPPARFREVAPKRRDSNCLADGRSGYGAVDEENERTASTLSAAAVVVEPSSPVSVHSDDEFGDEDWALDHPMEPIRFGGLLIKPFNPRAEYLFTSLQVVAGSMSSFVHGAVAGANATATFVVLYEAFTNHELGKTNLSSQWSVLPAMLGIAIGMFALGASLMKTVGMELVTVTPVRGWSIQVGGTAVTMVLTGLGIPVSLSQSQVGAAIGCGVLDARMAGVSWPLVAKIVGGWVVTLVISASTTGFVMWFLYWVLC